MLHKFSLPIIVIALIVALPSMGIAQTSYNEWEYFIEDTDKDKALVDINKSTVDIDYEERVIKLPKMPAPDVIKFTNMGDYDYAVLEKDGMKYYGFNGERMIPINSLSVDVYNPLGFAVNPVQPSFFISEHSADNDDNNSVVKNYVYSEKDEKMVDNPYLSSLGLDYVYSLSTFETGELAVLTEKNLTSYSYDSKNMVALPKLSIDENLDDPIAVATNKDYHFAILSEEKVEHYMFSEKGLIKVSALEVSINKEELNPMGLAIDDDKTFILDEEGLNVYTLDATDNEMKLNVNMSISKSNGLKKPQALAFNNKTSDIVIVDEIDNKDGESIFEVKYYMFNGEKHVYNKSLSQTIGELAIGSRYKKEGEYVTNILASESEYIDLVRVRAYTEVPENTEIEFFVSYKEEPEWKKSWLVKNDKVYKFIDNEYKEFGDIRESYPTFNLKDDADYKEQNYEIIEDEDGNIEIEGKKRYDLGLWTNLNGDKTQNKVLIKAVLKTKNPNVTPKIFAPIGSNNEKELMKEPPDDMAIKIDVNAEPEPPKINPIDPGHQDPEGPGFEPKEGWIYTTTPTIKWEFIDVDKENYQTYYQLLVMAKNDEGWHVLKNISTDRAEVENMKEDQQSHRIPTSTKPNEAGPMWQADSYEYAIAIRTWDDKGAISDFSEVENFKVLAFERPRIVNIVNPPESNNLYSLGSPPMLNDITSHWMILEGMKEQDLAVAKAGAQVTLYIDSVGPMIEPKENTRFFIDVNGEEHDVYMSDFKKTKDTNNRARWEFNFFTKAPIEMIPNNTLVKAKFIGPSTDDIGGTTVFYIPSYAEGVVTTKETIYKDWQVIIQGRDR